MKPLPRWISFGLGVSTMALTAITAGAAEQTTTSGGPTTSLQTEYIMRMYVRLEIHVVGDGLRIVNHPGGWIEGPRIKGKIVPPSGDWLRTTADGLNRLDVRLTLQTDDGATLYMSYNGIFQCEEDIFERYLKGQTLKSDNCYFISAPRFETRSERYGWLNGIQAVGKMIEVTRGDDAHLIYDIFSSGRHGFQTSGQSPRSTISDMSPRFIRSPPISALEQTNEGANRRAVLNIGPFPSNSHRDRPFQNR